MEKHIYDKNNGLWYELHGDYYIPCLLLSDTEERSIGIWGRKHLGYIKEYHPVLYSDLVLNCKSHSYLADIDAQAQDRLALLIKQMAEKEGVTEQLKARDQMAWVRAMNSIRNRTEEIVNAEIISDKLHTDFIYRERQSFCLSLINAFRQLSEAKQKTTR